MYRGREFKKESSKKWEAVLFLSWNGEVEIISRGLINCSSEKKTKIWLENECKRIENKEIYQGYEIKFANVYRGKDWITATGVRYRNT